MTDVVPTVATINAPADPSVVNAIGLHHTLQTAVADLIDNSLDAGARNVTVRFVQQNSEVVALRIYDDGVGMDSATLESAMVFGRRRHYDAGQLGAFGVGMKAASLSQANALVVWSKAASPAEPCARTIADRSKPHEIGVISDSRAAAELDDPRPRFSFETGTIVELKGLRTFLRIDDSQERMAWLEDIRQELHAHLGIVFHRRIEAGVTIHSDIFDADAGRPGAVTKIAATDPFGYDTATESAFPATLSLELDGAHSSATAHIWPARNSSTKFRLFGAPGREYQGLFVYRADRLLHMGGWGGVVRPRPHFGLARVVIDLDDVLSKHIVINAEKSGVTVDATFGAALQRAMGDVGFLEAAEATARNARKTQPRPVTIVELGHGISEDVLLEFEDAFTLRGDYDPVTVRWRALAPDKFFEVDLVRRELLLNARLRRGLLGHRSRNEHDAPLLKTLLYLLTQEMFAAQRHSARQQQQMQAWQDVLMAAVSAETAIASDRDEMMGGEQG